MTNDAASGDTTAKPRQKARNVPPYHQTRIDRLQMRTGRRKRKTRFCDDKGASVAFLAPRERGHWETTTTIPSTHTRFVSHSYRRAEWFGRSISRNASPSQVLCLRYWGRRHVHRNTSGPEEDWEWVRVELELAYTWLGISVTDRADEGGLAYISSCCRCCYFCCRS